MIRHIYVKRAWYDHHGLDCGDGTVIHYSGRPGQRGVVERTSVDLFAGDQQLHEILHVNRRFTNRETVVRAESRLGESTYRLLQNNCEHFVNWCISGRGYSPQVRAASIAAGLTLLTRLTPVAPLAPALVAGPVRRIEYALR